MEKQTRNVTMAKILTFVTFGVLLVLGAFFFIGSIERGVLLEKKAYGIVQLIDEMKLIFEDVSGYFKTMWDAIESCFELIEETGSGFATLLMAILNLLFPFGALVSFFMVALHLVLSWIPLVSVDELGWNSVCRRMSKKLKKVVGWMLGFMIYAFVQYGKSSVGFTALGNVALWLIAVYAVVRVLLNGIGRQDTVLHTIVTTVSAAAIALFLVLVLRHVLLMEGYLLYSIFANLEMMILTKDSDLRMISIYLALYTLCVYIALQISAKAMGKQMVMKRNGVRGYLIALFIFVVVAAVLHFFAFKKMYSSLSFSDWMDSEESKFVVKSVIYGLIGLALAIVTSFVKKIGIPQEPEEEMSIE